jgi:hypothetical protein
MLGSQSPFPCSDVVELGLFSVWEDSSFEQLPFHLLEGRNELSQGTYLERLGQVRVLYLQYLRQGQRSRYYEEEEEMFY